MWFCDLPRVAEGVGVRLEATGGFEPPNRGFADLRLSPLGYVASSRWVSVRPVWCRGWDLNPHRRMPTAPSRPRVYQFHHLGLAARRILYHASGSWRQARVNPECGSGLLAGTTAHNRLKPRVCFNLTRHPWPVCVGRNLKSCTQAQSLRGPSLNA